MCPNSAFPDVFSLPFLSLKRAEETTTEEALRNQEMWQVIVRKEMVLCLSLFYSLIYSLDTNKENSCKLRYVEDSSCVENLESCTENISLETKTTYNN